MVDPNEDSEDRLRVFSDDRFLDVEPIGEGRNAFVFRAFDRDLRRPVALKVTVQDGLLSPTSRKRLAELGIEEGFEALVEATREGMGRYTLLREARLLARIEHPNVVPVLEIGRLEEDGAVAVVMPLLTGGELEDRELGERWQDVLDVALRIGEGLAAIHDTGILHRDFKPNNVLFDGEGRPRIADLGLACEVSDAEAMAEHVGTARYMAPEVICRHTRDHRDDLYAYCVVVFEMFYGHSPFASFETRFAGEVSKIERPGGMSPKLREVLIGGLHPDPEQRWPDMRTLLTAMERTLRPWRAWGWTAAAASLAAALAIGVFASTRTAEADACEEIADEFAQIWTDETRTELRDMLGTRMAGDNLQSWVGRWVTVRAQECDAARRGGRSTEPTPCSAKMRDHFRATVKAFANPNMREGLKFTTVIAELPAPEYCIEHPDDGDWGQGQLLGLREIDTEVMALVLMGDLDTARARQREYLELAKEQSSEFGVTRAMFWGAEIQRLEGELDEALHEFALVYGEALHLGAPELGGEAMMKLAAIAGARGNVEAVDAYALAALGLFEAHAPDRVAELLQVHGLALMSGPDRDQERGRELLGEAIERCEAQLRRYGGTRELISQARESYARGLLAVERASEALEYLNRALDVHQDEFGHGTWRTRPLLRQKFLAMIQLGRLEEANAAQRALINFDINSENNVGLAEDVVWMANEYTNMGRPDRAIWVLRLGRDVARERGFVAESAHFGAELTKMSAD